MKDFLRIDVMNPLNIFLVELHMPLNTMEEKIFPRVYSTFFENFSMSKCVKIRTSNCAIILASLILKCVKTLKFPPANAFILNSYRLLLLLLLSEPRLC